MCLQTNHYWASFSDKKNSYNKYSPDYCQKTELILLSPSCPQTAKLAFKEKKTKAQLLSPSLAKEAKWALFWNICPLSTPSHNIPLERTVNCASWKLELCSWSTTPMPVFIWKSEGACWPSALQTMTEGKKYHFSVQKAYCSKISTVTSSFVS